jgi:hypothetical protein
VATAAAVPGGRVARVAWNADSDGRGGEERGSEHKCDEQGYESLHGRFLSIGWPAEKHLTCRSREDERNQRTSTQRTHSRAEVLLGGWRKEVHTSRRPEEGSHVTVKRQPEVGEPAPPIAATTATGDSFDLADALGGYAVIWFFPRANTPG